MWYEMNRPYLIFLLFHDQMSVSEDVCKKSMAFNIYFHNFGEIHNLEIFLKYQRAIKDDKFISNNNNEPIIVSYNSEYELDKPIVYQEKYDGE